MVARALDDAVCMHEQRRSEQTQDCHVSTGIARVHDVAMRRVSFVENLEAGATCGRSVALEMFKWT
eukprot:6195753-Pleurochrysis_carterae.AAC.5